MLKQFPLLLVEADEAILFEVRNFNIINGCYYNNLTAGASFRVSLLFGCLRTTCAQSEHLDCTSRHSATKMSQIVVPIYNTLFLKVLYVYQSFWRLPHPQL